MFVLVAVFVSMCVCPCRYVCVDVLCPCSYVCVDVFVLVAMFVSMCVSL